MSKDRLDDPADITATSHKDAIRMREALSAALDAMAYYQSDADAMDNVASLLASAQREEMRFARASAREDRDNG